MGTETIDGPYHAGERAVQEWAGERWRAERTGRIVGRSIPAPALEFVGRQSMVVLGSRNRAGRAWASLLFGPPGFLDASDPQVLEIDLGRALGHPADPFHAAVGEDPRVGVLLIELETRRRLRVNGPVERRPGRLRVQVEEAYPNCPKYIQRRRSRPFAAASGDLPDPVRGRVLTSGQRDWIATADTFFVASAHPVRGIDVSHRGGDPGFVRVLDRRTLRIPDYPGNGMFNTLGNLAVDPAAGLTFPDFAGDRVLQLTGRAEIRRDLDDAGDATGGTGRFWEFTLTEGRESRLPLRAEWEFLDHSPHNPPVPGEPRGSDPRGS